MVKEVSIKTIKYENIPEDSTILVVGKDNERRTALCNSILKGICSEGKSQSLSPFVFYDNGSFKLLAVRELDSHLLNKKVDYIVMMDDISDDEVLYQIWEKSACNKPIAKFATFKTIYNNCASGNDVLWIDCNKSITQVIEKVFWSSFVVVKDYSKKSDQKLTLNIPQKISHIDEEKQEKLDSGELTEEMVKKMQEEGYCTIL